MPLKSKFLQLILCKDWGVCFLLNRQKSGLAFSGIQFCILRSLILQVMTAILVGLGVLLALISHVGTKEPLSKHGNPDIPLTRLSTLQAANFAVVSLCLVYMLVCFSLKTHCHILLFPFFRLVSKEERACTDYLKKIINSSRQDSQHPWHNEISSLRRGGPFLKSSV